MTPTVLSPTVSVSGLSSGVDWQALVRQLMEVERRPLTLVEARQTALSAQKALWGDIRSRLAALKAALAPLRLTGTFTAKSATSTDESAVSGVATASANAATYRISVTALAQAHTVASDAVADVTAALGLAGAFQVNGKDVVVQETDSLQAIRDALNATADIGVTASIVDRRLVIKRAETGATQIQFVDSPEGILRSLGVLAEGGAVKNELVAAQGAQFSVDGLPIVRSANAVSDVIDGVTLHLKKQTASPVDLAVSLNTQAGVDAVKAFVDAYNAAHNLVMAKLAKGAELQGDATLRQISQTMRTVVYSPVSGMTTAFDDVSDIGITTDQAGRLVLEATKLAAALSQDPEAVKALFFSDEAGVTGIGEVLESHLESWTEAVSGLIPMRQAGLDSRIAVLDKQIERLEYRLSLREATLVSRFIEMERVSSAMQTQSAWLGQQVAYMMMWR